MTTWTWLFAPPGTLRYCEQSLEEILVFILQITRQIQECFTACVMFLHMFICPPGCSAIPPSGNRDPLAIDTSFGTDTPTPLEQTAHWEQTPPPGRWEVTSYPLEGTWDQTLSDIIPLGTTEVGSTHPTGMLSCFLFVFPRNHWEVAEKLNRDQEWRLIPD